MKVLDKEGQAIPRDLSSLNPEEMFTLKQEIAAQTKFTGKPSDDKTVNSLLKGIYGDIKQKLNTAVSPNNPEIMDLNQKYADLTSAELATKNRDAIVKRADLTSLPGKEVLGGTGVVSLLTGNPAPVLAGMTAVALDKALASTAVKTRIAAWLGSESPTIITEVLRHNPAIRTVLYRALPKFASQLSNPQVANPQN